jgi:hypothetical protein
MNRLVGQEGQLRFCHRVVQGKAGTTGTDAKRGAAVFVGVLWMGCLPYFRFCLISFPANSSIGTRLYAEHQDKQRHQESDQFHAAVKINGWPFNRQIKNCSRVAETCFALWGILTKKNLADTPDGLHFSKKIYAITRTHRRPQQAFTVH